DYLVLIDTSASKAQGPLLEAQNITRELAAKLGANDRMALWTVNLREKKLTNGFKSGKELETALKDLAKEVPLGAVNLKAGLNKAIDSFDEKAGRQRVILFLGDGKSVAEPVTGNDRAELCARMIKKQIAFFAVPVGLRLEPQNLHGLASGTGG